MKFVKFQRNDGRDVFVNIHKINYITDYNNKDSWIALGNQHGIAVKGKTYEIIQIIEENDEEGYYA